MSSWDERILSVANRRLRQFSNRLIHFTFFSAGIYFYPNSKTFDWERREQWKVVEEQETHESERVYEGMELGSENGNVHQMTPEVVVPIHKQQNVFSPTLEILATIGKGVMKKSPWDLPIRLVFISFWCPLFRIKEILLKRRDLIDS